MPIAGELLDASFKGFSFLVPRERETGGRKFALHEYPGNDQRFVEDLGKRLPTFNVLAVIHGLSVVQQRQRFTAILASAGAGTLVHPYLGRLEVLVTNYELSTSDAALGEVVYNVEFTQTVEARSLLGSTTGFNGVVFAAENARSALDSAVGGRYSPMRIADSISKVGARVREGIAVVQGQVSTVINPVTDALNTVTREIAVTRADVFSVVRTPQQLTTAMRGVFGSFLALGETPADLRAEWANLTNFGAVSRFLPNGQRARTLGSVRSPIDRTTQKRVIEDNNLRILDQYIRIEALIDSFEAEADAEFATDDELSFVRERLTDDFNRIIQNQDDVVATSNLGDEVLTDASVILPSQAVSEAQAFSDSLGFDPDLRSALEELRVAAFAVLNEDVKDPSRVREFNLGLMDLQLATHALYGDQDLVETLAALNPNQNHAFIQRPIKGVIT